MIKIGGLVMDMITVQSSNIDSIGYDKDAKILKVKFKGGTIYEYLDVPEIRHIFLMNETTVEGGSVGKFINHNIKGSYQYRQALTREALTKALNKLYSVDYKTESDDYYGGMQDVLQKLKDTFKLDIEIRKPLSRKEYEEDIYP
jgi:hypothetical protein